ncbi:MAG: hypothetical protein J2P15_21265, partial [Micromonosporaceae bacterium]|nr:hypothetical protein [Micromonosporaceae bacterium]
MSAPPAEPESEWWQRPIQRPSAVTAAGVILWVLAGLALLATCAFGALFSAHRPNMNGGALVLIAIIAAVTGIIDGLLGHNILRGRRWARFAAIAFGCLNIVLDVVAIVRGTPSACLSIAIQAVVISLLTT